MAVGEEGKELRRVSVLTLALMAAEVYAFVVGQAAEVEYRLDEPADFFSPRVLLCLFSAHSALGLALQLLYLLALMALAEAPRGSVFHLPEALAKVLLINALSTALYWLLAPFRAQAGVDAFLRLQAAAPVHGFGFLCALETLQAVLALLRGSTGRSRDRLKLFGLFCLLSALTAVYYYRLPFLAAVALGVALAVPRLSLSTRMHRSKLLRAVDWRLGWARRALFVRGKTQEAAAIELHPPPMEVRVAGGEEAGEAAVEEETRSRHEEINVSDYMRPPSAQPRDADSFEV